MDVLADDDLFLWSKRVDPPNIESLVWDLLTLEEKFNEV
jgi:hypothetical protein